jgi:type II secretory pathway component PulJ
MPPEKQYESVPGCTIVEVIVALVITSIVKTAIYSVYTAQQKSYMSQAGEDVPDRVIAENIASHSFTCLDVVISISILTVGLLGVATMRTTANRGNDNAYRVRKMERA